MNKVAMNMGIQTSHQDSTFSSFGCVPGSTTVGFYSNSILDFLRNFCIVFHGATPFYILINSAQGFQCLYIQ
jgi:hypothetical protein